MTLATLILFSLQSYGPIYKYVEGGHDKTATTYGWGEMMCGDVGKARSCSEGAITASGQVFDPELPTAAIAAPFNLRMPKTGVEVYMKVEGGECTKILVNDKKNPRFIGKKPFDLTPGALRALGVNPTRHWSGKVLLCTQDEIRKVLENEEIFDFDSNFDSNIGICTPERDPGD